MKKIVFVLLFMMLVIQGCTRESGNQAGPAQRGPNAGAEQAGSLPKISFAEIVTTNPVSGTALTVKYTISNGAVNRQLIAFRWYVNGVPVDDATGDTLDPQYFGKGDTVEADVIPTDGARQETPFRTKSITIMNTPPVVTSARLTPVPAYPGDTVTVVPEGNDVDGDAITYQYQWIVNGKNVEGGEDGKYDTSQLKKKDIIAANVVPFDGEDRGSAVTTTYLALSDRVPDITSQPASGLQDGVYTYQVAAKDPDGDPVTYSLAEAPPGMTIESNTGLIRWQPEVDHAGARQVTVKVAADDGDGGVAYQQFSLNVELK